MASPRSALRGGRNARWQTAAHPRPLGRQPRLAPCASARGQALCQPLPAANARATDAVPKARRFWLATDCRIQYRLLAAAKMTCRNPKRAWRPLPVERVHGTFGHSVAASFSAPILSAIPRPAGQSIGLCCQPAEYPGVVDNRGQNCGALRGVGDPPNRLFRQRYLISGRFACHRATTYHATVCKGNKYESAGRRHPGHVRRQSGMFFFRLAA